MNANSRGRDPEALCDLALAWYESQGDLLKAIRSLEPRGRGWLWEDSEWALADGAPADLEAFLAPSDTRLWRMVGLLRHGHARPSEIAAATAVALTSPPPSSFNSCATRHAAYQGTMWSFSAPTA